jgi:hypothetical protein
MGGGLEAERKVEDMQPMGDREQAVPEARAFRRRVLDEHEPGRDHGLFDGLCDLPLGEHHQAEGGAPEGAQVANAARRKLLGVKYCLGEIVCFRYGFATLSALYVAF